MENAEFYTLTEFNGSHVALSHHLLSFTCSILHRQNTNQLIKQTHYRLDCRGAYVRGLATLMGVNVQGRLSEKANIYRSHQRFRLSVTTPPFKLSKF